MTEGINEPFAATNFSDQVANAVCIGSDSPDVGSFPTTWTPDRIFYRTDRKRLYVNDSAAGGTIDNPIWRGVDTEIGQIQQHAGPANTIGPGWLLCNGDTVPRDTYPELFQVIGILYGPGNGNTTFHLPNFTTGNKLPRPATDDAALGTEGGTADITLSELKSDFLLTDIGEIPRNYQANAFIDAIAKSSTVNRSDNGTPPTHRDYIYSQNNVYSGVGSTYLDSYQLATLEKTFSDVIIPPFLSVHYKIAV